MARKQSNIALALRIVRMDQYCREYTREQLYFVADDVAPAKDRNGATKFIDVDQAYETANHITRTWANVSRVEFVPVKAK